MARRPAKRRGNTVSIAWNEAEISNAVTRKGTYTFRVTKAEEGDDGQVIVDSVVTSEGRQEGKTIRTYFNTTPKSLWVLARFLEAIGEDIPDEAADLDLDDLVDKEYMATVGENEYDGKIRLRIEGGSYAPIDAADDEEAGARSSKKDDDEEEEETKPAKGSKKSKEPEKLSKDAVEEMDRDDLEGLIEEHELDVDPADRKLKRDDDALREAVLEALEEKDLLEEEEAKPAKRGRGRPPKKRDESDDEDTSTKSSARGSGSGAKKSSSKDTSKKGGKLPKVSEDEIQDMTEEELEELNEKYGLEIDLDDHKSLRKKAAAIIDALNEGGHIE